jgi:hypothetical protein
MADRSELPARLRRLLPEPGSLTPTRSSSNCARRLRLERAAVCGGEHGRHRRRPASVAGRTAPLSSVADRQFFHAQRTRVDAVLMGAGTLHTERYGRLVRAAHRRDRRVANGLTSDPLAIVVNGSLDLPGTLPLLQDSASRVRARLVSRVVCRDGDDSLCQPLHQP